MYSLIFCQYIYLLQVLLGIRQILEGRGAPRAPGITLPTPGQNQHELWCDRSLNHLLPTIQYWLVQLQAMKVCVLHISTACPVTTINLYDICTTLNQSRRCWADFVQMLYKCFVFAG